MAWAADSGQSKEQELKEASPQFHGLVMDVRVRPKSKSKCSPGTPWLSRPDCEGSSSPRGKTRAGIERGLLQVQQHCIVEYCFLPNVLQKRPTHNLCKSRHNQGAIYSLLAPLLLPRRPQMHPASPQQARLPINQYSRQYLSQRATCQQPSHSRSLASKTPLAVGLLSSHYRKLSRNVTISQRLFSLRNEKPKTMFHVRPRELQPNFGEPAKLKGRVLPCPNAHRATLVRRSKSVLESLSQQVETRQQADCNIRRERRNKLKLLSEKNYAPRIKHIGDRSKISLENYLRQVCKSYYLQHIRGQGTSPKARHDITS